MFPLRIWNVLRLSVKVRVKVEFMKNTHHRLWQMQKLVTFEAVVHATLVAGHDSFSVPVIVIFAHNLLCRRHGRIDSVYNFSV